MKELAVRQRPTRKAKRVEPTRVAPLSPVRLRHAHPDRGPRLLAVSPAASIALAVRHEAPRSNVLLPFLLVMLGVGAFLLVAAATPVWRIQHQLGLASFARAIDRHQLDLALGGGALLFVTLTLYLVAAQQ